MTSWPRKNVFLLLLLAVAAGLVLLALKYFGPGGKPSQQGAVAASGRAAEAGSVSTNAAKRVSSAQASAAAATNAQASASARALAGAGQNVKGAAAAVKPEPVKDLAGAEITKGLDQALDDDNTTNILAAARTLLGHQNPEVRKRVVEALNWVGVEGFSELTTLLADTDQEVAEAARDAWKMQFDMIEASEQKLELLRQAGDLAVKRGDVAFTQDVVDLITMDVDLPDTKKVDILNGYLKQTEDAESVEKILGALNDTMLPEKLLIEKSEADAAIAGYHAKLAAEAAEEAANAKGN